VPTAPVTVAVSLADKLDTLLSFYTIGEVPTGSKDPFALRRAAIGSIALILANNIRVSLLPLFMAMFQERVAAFQTGFMGNTPQGVLLLLADRLKVQQREAGVRHDLIDSVFALGSEDDLIRLLARVKALQEFVGTEDGTNLLVAYKRAANILKKEKWEGTGASRGSDLAAEEKALIDALDKAEPKAAAAIGKEDFTGAMAALAFLRKPIDSFFDHVTVNDPDKAKRERRLNLLLRFRDAVNAVADFSRIEG
jgi:glycyl-tRNA synthetase beta chain